jgi:hypothetical protein
MYLNAYHLSRRLRLPAAQTMMLWMPEELANVAI